MKCLINGCDNDIHFIEETKEKNNIYSHLSMLQVGHVYSANKQKSNPNKN